MLRARAIGNEQGLGLLARAKSKGLGLSKKQGARVEQELLPLTVTTGARRR